MRIGFNKPYITGNEIRYIKEVFESQKLSGNGEFTKQCQKIIEDRYAIKKCLLTSSGTDALEMAAILLDIKPGDEVIMPSYTFVSTANAFILRGAKVVFVDSSKENPNIEATLIEQHINNKTKAIVVVHYAGFSCDMDQVLAIASKRNVYVVEDAAQAIGGLYKKKPLGSLGHLACYSFHETKNIGCGEGGALLINDSSFIQRAEYIWEKGTNRTAFYRGEVDKYTWVDVGSSFLPSEITAAILFAQLQQADEIQKKRLYLWEIYYRLLSEINDRITLPKIPEYSTHNGHIFYLTTSSPTEQQELIKSLNKQGVNAIFHYLPLHSSPYYLSGNQQELPLVNCDMFASRLVRLPMYYELEAQQVSFIADQIKNFYKTLAT